MHNGVRIYGPRPQAIEPRMLKKHGIANAKLLPAIWKRTSNAGKPYYVEVLAMKANAAGDCLVYTEWKGKARKQLAPMADVEFNLSGVRAIDENDTVRLSWDDSRLAWKALGMMIEGHAEDDNAKIEEALRIRCEIQHRLDQQQTQQPGAGAVAPSTAVSVEE